MKKNVVIIHLEGVSNLLYLMHKEMFPNITAIEEKSLYFSKYYSTATSTLMIIGDLMYGTMEQYEQCSSLADIPSHYACQYSLFDDLKHQGYQTGIFVYPGGSDIEDSQRRFIVGREHSMELKTDYAKFIEAIDERMTPGSPFAVMSCNYISNIGISPMNKQLAAMDSSRRWKQGYELLDQSVGDIFSLLERKGLLDSTIVLMYGDHGEDYWQHSMHQGLVHGTEPYANMICTPLFLYDKSLKEKGSIDRLLCTTDLRSMVTKILERTDTDDMAESLLPSHKPYICARNAYANQPIRLHSFCKSYSVTDGRFLMLVSSRGLEFYDTHMDIMCMNNILDFYRINKERKFSYRDDIRDIVKYHYPIFMDQKEIRHLMKMMHKMKRKLYQYTLKLYLAGKRSECNMKSEMRFDKIAYRHSYSNRLLFLQKHVDNIIDKLI